MNQDRHSIPTKVADMAVGAHVTIPTTHSGTFTGVLVARRALGPYAAQGEFMATIQDDNGTQQEVRTNDAYSGWVNGSLPEQVVTIPAVALRPGHVIVDHEGLGFLVEHIRLADGMVLVDGYGTADGVFDGMVPFGPDATVSVTVPAP